MISDCKLQIATEYQTVPHTISRKMPILHLIDSFSPNNTQHVNTPTNRTFSMCFFSRKIKISHLRLSMQCTLTFKRMYVYVCTFYFSDQQKLCDGDRWCSKSSYNNNNSVIWILEEKKKNVISTAIVVNENDIEMENKIVNKIVSFELKQRRK